MALKPSKLSPQDKQKAEERRKQFLELQQQHLAQMAQLHLKPRNADPQRAVIVQRLQEAIKNKDKRKADMLKETLIILQKQRSAQRRQSGEQLTKGDLF